MAEITFAASKLKAGKAPGLDRVPAEVVKTAVAYIGEYVLEVMNRLLGEGTFPTAWKKAKLVLVPKPSQEGKYRPICLINTLGKLYEQLIRGRIQAELDDRDGISPHQHGFRSGHSTVSAASDLLHFARNAHRGTPSMHCIGVFLDIRNAFNTASWRCILEALESRGIPPYLLNVVRDYLTDRTVVTGPRESRKIHVGVPQGSVLGPLLWNVMYDDVLRVELPGMTKIIGYADDVVVVAKHRNWDELLAVMNSAIVRVDDWLRNHGLLLAPEKTEAIHFRFGRRKKNGAIQVAGETVNFSEGVKYLGIRLDPPLRFGPHIRDAAAKADRTIKALMRLMPNIDGPAESKRRALYTAAQSIMMYGAPIWAGSLNAAVHRNRILAVQRRMLLRICRGYRTVSTDAAAVLAAVVPIHLLCAESKDLAGLERKSNEDKKLARERTVLAWQREWEQGTKGAWTRRLIPDLRPWISRRHGTMTYYLTQALSGHGSFRKYLHGIGRAANAICIYCVEEDTAEHTIFVCPRWAQERATAAAAVNFPLSTDNLVETMLASRSNWKVIERMAMAIFKDKEKEEVH